MMNPKRALLISNATGNKESDEQYTIHSSQCKWLVTNFQGWAIQPQTNVYCLSASEEERGVCVCVCVWEYLCFKHTLSILHFLPMMEARGKHTHTRTHPRSDYCVVWWPHVANQLTVTRLSHPLLNCPVTSALSHSDEIRGLLSLHTADVSLNRRARNRRNHVKPREP